MSKIIDFLDFKNKERKEIEDKAYQQYGILKLSDDLYLYPETSFTTGSLDLKVFFESKLCMDIEEILEADVIESINNIVDLPKQTVNIFLVEEGENDMHTFEIINVSNNKNFLLSTQFINDIDKREILTAIVAGAIKKINVQVTYMMELSYDDLEETIY
ncbi:MAG: hypothetical protein PUJ51_13425 [Clostridiales bacterium]|uniref:hypothetical protein n=1 Tax=Terrisporobacter sp. TaxID=1965305 RepID=UPI002A4F2BD2|nr:hypothetical protein [Terrisporobacter sp.]MCI6458655.1 hypothetical protein [Clostridium sp.]MDD7755486.1 hypothetical protein [Clostridiales bacterium]MDY4137217.1 hypothetical protein [Terrisporobacter sp.]MDY4736170.1 hypothetical protein [Terrisporobacter sp.]